MQHRSAGLLKSFGRLLEIVHLETDMLNAITVRVQEFLPTGVPSDRLDQFERELSDFEERQFRLALGWAASEHGLYFMARFGGRDPRRAYSEHCSPMLASGFDV